MTIEIVQTGPTKRRLLKPPVQIVAGHPDRLLVTHARRRLVVTVETLPQVQILVRR